MKVCPNCRKEYEDDVEVCPDDETELIPAPEDLPENPEPLSVLQVSPDEHTAMIDLEAIDAERGRRGITTPEPEPEPEPEEDDPEATGTLHHQKRGPEGTQAGGDGSFVDATAEGQAVEDSDEGPGETLEITALPPDVVAERTQITRTRQGRSTANGRKDAGGEGGGKRMLVVVGIIAVAIVIAGGLMGAAFYFFGAGKRAVLTVTTLPPGATVFLDGDELGAAPLQEKVKVGSHVLELKRAGYEPFKEVIDVPVEGLPFMQPLTEDPDYVAPPEDAGPAAEGEGEGEGENVVAAPTSDAGAATAPSDGGAAAAVTSEDAGPAAPPKPEANALLAAFDDHLKARAFDKAFEVLKTFVRTWPDDKRSDTLFERLADARMKVAAGTGGTKRPPVKKDKKRRAKEAYAEGELLYRERSYDEAKFKFQSSIQLDPRFARPHRALARIYQRDKNIDRARYHLERFLGLGGGDPDYKVRRWLEEHARQ